MDFQAHLRVEACSGFVKKEQGGVVDQAKRDGEALLLATGERGIVGIALILKLQALQQHVGVRHPAVEGTEEFQSFVDLDLIGQVGGLETDADAVLELLLLFVGIIAEHENVAGGSLPNTFQDLDGGGFTGTVGAEEAEDFASLHFEVDAADGLEVTVRFMQAADGDCKAHEFYYRLTDYSWGMFVNGQRLFCNLFRRAQFT